MKRIVSLLIAAILTIAMTATAFAANPKITTQIAELSGGYVGDAYPGQKIFLPFGKAAFEGATVDLTASDVRTSNITVKHTVKAGPKAIESIDIKTSNDVAGVLVTLVDSYTSVKPLDFEVVITLYINGKRQSHTTTVEGTLTNDQQYVDSGDDYIDLSDGSVAVCEGNVTKIEAYLGENVSMFVRMVKGKSYAGVATTNPTDADIDMLVEYPDIVNIYTLTVDGLTGTGKIVQIDSTQTLYVYDENLSYIGTTDSLLPFSNKYYVAEKKLDVIEQTEDEWIDEDEPEYLGDGELESETEPEDIANKSGLPAVSNTGYGSNPDTGVPPLLGASAVAGILALVAMSAVSFKKKK